MKLVKQDCELINNGYTVDDIYRSIELAGRNCYKSEDKITDNSALSFIIKLRELRHTSVLEHGTLYFDIIADDPADPEYYAKIEFIKQFKNNKYSKVIEYKKEHFVNNKYVNLIHYAITTNYRVLCEQLSWSHLEKLKDAHGKYYNNATRGDFLLRFLCAPTEYHHKRITIRFITSIGISREFCRHRVFSFCEESTRYCNYSLDKFDNGITFIYPLKNEEDNNDSIFNKTLESYKRAESEYLELLEEGASPQIARRVLPLGTKTELIMTGFLSDWLRFFNQRTASNAHPEAREIATKAEDLLVSNGYLLRVNIY